MIFTKYQPLKTKISFFPYGLSFILIVANPILFVYSKTIGPDIVARARLLRDLPLTRTLLAQSKVGQRSPEHVTNIYVSISARAVDLDFKNGVFSINGWIALRWNDERYGWNPSDYEGLTSIPLPFSTSWAPDLVLVNAAEDKFIDRQVGVVKSNGDIVYVVGVLTKSNCAPNYNNYPFGIQTCQLKFGSWVNEHYKVQYRLASTSPDQISSNKTKSVMTEDISLKEYDSPIGWRVIGTRAYMESTQHFPPLLEEPAQNIVFSLVFQRDFVFDADNGVTKRPSTNEMQNNPRQSNITTTTEDSGIVHQRGDYNEF